MAEEDGLAQVTSVTSTSWFQRIGQAFMGVLIGFLLIPLSIALLFWNCLLYTSPSPRDRTRSRMPSSA